MKTFNKIVTGLVIEGIILSTGIAAFASTTSSSDGSSTLKTRTSMAGKLFKGGKGHGSIYGSESSLKSLVAAGVLTQAEADKITALSTAEEQARQAEMDKVRSITAEERKAYFESNQMQVPKEKGDIFTLAVSRGILTQTKADTAKAKLQEIRDAERQAKLTEELKGLVTAGTITQAQADKVIAYINTLEANKPVQGTSTAADKNSNAVKINPLSALVDNGTLTQAQLDAVTKILPFGKGHGHGFKGGKGMDRHTGADSADAASSATTSAAKTE